MENSEEMKLAEQIAEESGGTKQIKVEEVRVGDLVDMDGNPRKITTKKKKELQDSLEMFGDFSILVIDEKNRIISGHQRVDAMTALYGPDHTAWAKRLIGYSEPELKAINIKCNTHAGEFDMNKLAAWTADLHINLGLDVPQLDGDNHEIKQMELIRYEKYDYVMIVCRSEVDYNNLTRALGIEDKKVVVAHKKEGVRKIKCRAIWYDDMKAQIQPKKK